MKTFIILFILALILPACGPSPEQIQAAIYETQTAIFTPTSTVTYTPTSTATPTPTVTTTPTPTVTPSPTPDLRIITDETQKYLCLAEELPKEGRYYLPDASWMEYFSNESPKFNTDKKKEYIARTGRISSWTVEYLRGMENIKMPENIFCGVTKFESIEGAKLSMREYSYNLNPERNYTFITDKPGLGDDFAIATREIIHTDGRKLTALSISFSYRNTMTDISIYGKADEVTYELAFYIANLVLDKLKEAPLSN